MCGICGFLASAPLPSGTLQRMNDVIFRRGPDGQGLLQTDTVGLAMRRLAIIDIAGGDQPIYNEDRSVVLVFNGEIYNYRTLRAGLLARGHQLRTESDTEVIVHLYEERGADLVRELEGMFAFALWDAARQQLLLARDRLGIKPLYIAQLPNGLLFGSEIKSLLATGLAPREIDWQALDGFLTYTFIPAPRSIYAAIRQVPPATTVTIGADGRLRQQTYWRVPDVPAETHPEQEWVARIERSLQAAVESHLVSDVPVGAFLSGGVDSGLMVAMMAAASERPVETFTVGFAQAGSAFLDERQYARLIAQRYRLNHHEITVEPHVADIIEDIVAAFDEPFADDSVIPSYYVSQAAAGFVKVALTGLGGDELFGGYRRHLGVRLGDGYARLPRVLRERLIGPLVRRLPEPRSASDVVDHLKRFTRGSDQSAASRYQDSMSTLPAAERARLYRPEVTARLDLAATTQVLTDAFALPRHGDSVARALQTDLRWYLPDDILRLTDRLSMWHSLELRVPYLDYRLVEEAMRIPSALKIRGMRQKHLLKEVARRWLPASVIDHRKQGFEAPMGQWLRGPLRTLMRDTLGSRSLAADGIFDPATVEQLQDEHLSGRRKHSKILFSLLMFQLWHAREPRAAISSRTATASLLAAGQRA